MYAKYEVSISNGSIVMAKVKVFLLQSDRDTDIVIDRQTEQKLNDQEFHPGGLKMYLLRESIKVVIQM